MKDAPSKTQMMNVSWAGRGEPNYVDKGVENPDNKFYPNRGDSAPAYVGTNPRYWEYR